MNAIEKLTKIFSEFPGIGPRQARRFVYYLLTRNGSFLTNFVSLIGELKKEISKCSVCQRYFPNDKSKSTECPICRDEHRDSSILVIVARDVDLENIEKSHSFSGKYFVLGGTVPILEKNPEERIRQVELLKLVEKLCKNKIPLAEIVFAMNLTPDGEHTEEYLRDFLKPLQQEFSLKFSTLGRGLSTGTELEYSDSETIKNALKNRQ